MEALNYKGNESDTKSFPICNRHCLKHPSSRSDKSSIKAVNAFLETGRQKRKKETNRVGLDILRLQSTAFFAECIRLIQNFEEDIPKLHNLKLHCFLLNLKLQIPCKGRYGTFSS